MRVIIAAAGTGGHINPGIAIANKIKEEQPESEIIFIGTQRGLEKDLVPRAGYQLKIIEAYGLSKKININNIKNMIRTYKSINKSSKIIKEFKPDIVIGTGGYICGPVIMAAHKNKIPAVIHESNAFPGLATKMLSKKVATIMVAFEEAKKRINHKNVVITGTPTKLKKLHITEEKEKQIKRELGLKENQKTILVFGGSQGAQAINKAMIELIEKGITSYQIMWAPGPEQYEKIKQELERKNIEKKENVKIVPYIYNMQEVMNISDLVIARSGAITITEISTIGKPSILIPLPNVSNNHQEYNARVLANIEAAEIILNQDLTGEKLKQKIDKIITNEEKTIKMGNSARQVHIENVEEKIYKEIEKAIKKRVEVNPKC